MSKLHFNKMTIIGAGLIGSSLARAVKQLGLVRHLAIADVSQDVCDYCVRTGFADSAVTSLADAVHEADFIVLATPLSTFGPIAQQIAPHIKPGAILSDVGSAKQSVIDDVTPHLSSDVQFVPAHPIAGTEFSGPESGFPELFRARWCVLTPMPRTSLPALGAVQDLWEAIGSHVTIMPADHHDRVLALTSHLPSLISFSIVNTAADLGEHMQSEVLQFSAGGFRGFTRLAQQDPIVWRDIFLTNREALLEQLHLLQEDLSVLTRAIRWGDGDFIEQRLTRAREIRKGLKD